MARGGKRKAKQLIEDSDDEEDEGRVTVAAAVAGESSDDDSEANADLSLQVAERAMRRRGVFWNGNVGASPGGGVRGLAGELASSSSADTVGAANGEGKGAKKKKNKKKKVILKVRNEEAGVRSVVPALIGEENAEAVEKLEAAVKAAEVVEPVDDKVVEIPDNLELRKLLRGPRYFDPPSSGWATCYNCGEEGHIAVNCTAKKKRKPCFVCGSLDHHGMQCAKGLECFICKKAGHRARDCSDKQGSLSEDMKLCLKCGESGHDMFSCGNDYHPDDLKEIQCYVCKKIGHLCCVNFGNNNKTVISCFRCGEWGHDGLACTRLQENDANSGVPFPRDSLFKRKSAHDSPFKKKYAHSASPHATKALKRATKAMKKLAESKASSVQPRKSKKKSSPKTAPPAVGKTRKKKKSGIDKGTNSTPQKSRGGWITEDPGDTSRSKMKKYNWNSPSTLSSKPYKYNSGAQSFQGSEAGYQQQYSASRYGYSGGTHDSPGQMLGTPGSYGHPARTYGHSSSTYGHHNTYGHSGSTYDHRNTYGHSGSTYGHHNTYGPSSGRHHHDTYGHSGSMYSHHNIYGHSGNRHGDHNTNGHSGGAYDHPSSRYGHSSSSYDPPRTYGSSQVYGHHGNTHGNSGGGHDNGRGLFGNDSSSRPRWNHDR